MTIQQFCMYILGTKMAVSFLNKTVGRKAKDIGESHAQNKPLMQITLYTSIFIQSSTIF